MSLRIWLPLIGDTKDHSTSNITVTNNNATANSNGKIGGCYYFKTATLNLPSSALTSLPSGHDFSFACWYKANTLASTEDCIFHASKNSASWSNMVFWLGPRRDNNKIELCVGNAAGGYNVGYSTSTIATETWYHLAFTYSNGTAKIYINGNLDSTFSATAPDYSKITLLNIGGYTTSSYSIDGYLNDVRIYDHCLSAGEIKEISRALIMYWSLNKDSVIALNMIDHMEAGGRTTIINSYAFDAEFTANDTYAYINVNGALTLGNTYTLSFDVEGLPSGSTWAWSLWNSDNYSISVTKNGHYAYTFSPTTDKLPSGYSLTRFLFDDRARTGATGTVRFKNFKIEESLVDTPFRTRSFGQKVYNETGLVKNSSDASASTGCFPIVRSDSPRNSTSCWFNTNGKNLKMNTTSFLSRFTTGTVEWWAKLVTGGSSGVLPFTGQSTSYFLAASSNWTGAFYNQNVSAASGYSIKYYIDGVEDNTPPGADSKWHHYVVTGVNMSSWTQLWLNNYGNSSAWNASSIYYSDVKFYNTVLSAADVSTLYHNFASIYNSGSLASYDIKEN